VRPRPTSPGPIATPAPIASGFNFGNDSGGFPFDGECDDPRFVGNGVAADSILNSSNQMRDATDCRNMFNAGLATLRPGGGNGFPRAAPAPSINFGNDNGPFPFDGECDDPRFVGSNVAADSNIDSANMFRDATDCRNAFNSRSATLRAGGGNGFPRGGGGSTGGGSINFGNDNGPFPFDGECDDPRFAGNGVAADSNIDSANMFRDATDCRNAFNMRGAILRAGGGNGFPRGGGGGGGGGINFGDDSGGFPFDGECDDPRFSGPGMAASASLTSSNNFRDASDCRSLFNAGRVF